MNPIHARCHGMNTPDGAPCTWEGTHETPKAARLAVSEHFNKVHGTPEWMHYALKGKRVATLSQGMFV